MILTGESLRGENDLMFGIDQRLRVVRLHDPVRGGQLRGFIIHRVALNLLAAAADLRFALLEKFIQPLDLQLEAAFAFLLPFDFDLRVFIRLGMFGDNALQFFLKFVAFVFEIFERAAPFFGDVRGEFHAIKAEVCATQQFQFFTDQEDIAEDGRDFVLHGRDK